MHRDESKKGNSIHLESVIITVDHKLNRLIREFIGTENIGNVHNRIAILRQRSRSLIGITCAVSDGETIGRQYKTLVIGALIVTDLCLCF